MEFNMDHDEIKTDQDLVRRLEKLQHYADNVSYSMIEATDAELNKLWASLAELELEIERIEIKLAK